MRSLTSPSAGGTIVDRLKIYEGGHGGSSAIEALNALDGVPASAVNQPNGIAGLDASGKIPQANLPLDLFPTNAVQGPTSLVKGTIGTYTINNYDVFTNYTVTAISGTVSISGNTITYNAPASPGAGGFILNGRTINIIINDYQPDTPVITVTDSKDGAGSKVTASGSAFNIIGVSNTHLNTDWEISLSNDFSSVLQSSYADAVNKTSWTASALNLTTTYYVRCRYRSSGNYLSNWSNVFSITTKTSYPLNIEQAKLTASDKFTNAQFGYSVAIDSTGTRVAIGSTTTNDAGAVYIFVRSGTSWSQEQKISPASSLAAGSSVSIDQNGTRVAIGSYKTTVSGTTNSGAVYIWIRSGTTWSQEQQIFPADKVASDSFGFSVSISGDGLRVAIGAINCDLTYSNQGAVYIWIRSGSTWTQEQKFSGSGADSINYKFGWSVSLDGTGLRVVIGVPDADPGGNTTAGVAYVFVRSGSTWSQEATLISNFTDPNDRFGWSVSFNFNGDRVAVGAPFSNVADQDPGGAYIFRRSGSSWTREQHITVELLDGPELGKSVSLNNDGSTVLIGSPGTTVNGALNAGAAYVFDRSGTTWGQQIKNTASDYQSDDYYGYAVAISSDGNKAVVGAFTEDPAGVSNAGSVYILTT